MSSVTLSGFGTDFLLTGGYFSFFEGPSNIFAFGLNTDFIVSPTNKYFPATGSFSKESEIKGWQYDKRILDSSTSLNFSYQDFVGGHKQNYKEGVSKNYWSSGVVDSIDYLLTRLLDFSGFSFYIPVVSTGIYTVYDNELYLYSDYSAQSKDWVLDEVTELYFLELDDLAMWTTIDVGLYKRNSDFIIEKYKSFEVVNSFTGEIEEKNRLDTEDSSGDFIPENICTRFKEVALKDNKLWVSKKHFVRRGYSSPPINLDTIPYETVRNLWEKKSSGVSQNRSMLLDFFPVDKDSFRLAEHSNQEFEEWTRVDSLNDSTPDDLHYVLNADLGIVQLGGAAAEPLFLAANISDTDEEIPFSFNENIKTYPEYGYIKLGTEIIHYTEISNGKFLGCTRGQLSTAAASHTENSVISGLQRGKKTSNEFFCSYIAVPMCEYEVTTAIERSCNSYTGYLNVSPVAHLNSNNILCITPDIKNVSKLRLEAEENVLSPDVYGPIFYNETVSRLKAKATNSNEEPVSEIPITFEIIQGPGTFQNELKDYTFVSNVLGESYSFYNVGYNKEESEVSVTNVGHYGNDTIMVAPELENDIDLNKVWIYQVLKFDKYYGSVGFVSEVLDEEFELDFPGFKFGLVISHLIDKDDYEDGVIEIVDGSLVKRTRKIRKVFKTSLNDGTSVSVIIPFEEFPPGTAETFSARLFKKGEQRWNPVIKQGHKVILYEFSNDYEHPVTGEAGAYAPVHPDSIEFGKLVFEDRLLAIPNSFDDSIFLGDYVIIAPQIVKIRAKCIDPASGKLVFSNTITLKIELPGNMIGVDYSGLLPVPHGWKFVTEEYNIGSAINGGNFITINPSTHFNNQFSIIGPSNV